MTFLELLVACAPLVAPVTMSALVEQESGGNPWALHDNTTGISYQPGNQADAIAQARQLMAAGHSLDLGLGQINSKNLAWLGQSVETIFQSCTNLKAAQTVLLAAWKQSGGQLPAALSVYNTGKVDGSVGAHYAASVYAKAQHQAPIVPAIPGGKLPAWVMQEMAGIQGTNGTDLAQASPQMSPPVRAILRFPKVTPANSPLNPDWAGLNPQ